MRFLMVTESSESISNSVNSFIRSSRYNRLSDKVQPYAKHRYSRALRCSGDSINNFTNQILNSNTYSKTNG